MDIRYHELSPEGYFERLKQAGYTTCILTSEEIERATAHIGTQRLHLRQRRGRYIREFAQGSEVILVNWKTVVLGHGRNAKVIRFLEYGQTAAKLINSPPRSAHALECPADSAVSAHHPESREYGSLHNG